MDIYDEIAKKAYDIWEESGRMPGRELENWLEAERIIKVKSKEEKGSEQRDSDKKRSRKEQRRKK